MVDRRDEKGKYSQTTEAAAVSPGYLKKRGMSFGVARMFVTRYCCKLDTPECIHASLCLSAQQSKNRRHFVHVLRSREEVH